jgi:hypothetical protein
MTVQQDPKITLDFEAAKRLADAIGSIEDSIKAMYASGLNRKAIYLLVSKASGVGIRDVEYVLSNAANLRSHFLNMPKAATK